MRRRFQTYRPAADQTRPNLARNEVARMYALNASGLRCFLVQVLPASDG